jgi:short-subunit dehydrogenase
MVAGVDTNIVGTLLLIKKIRRIRATAIAAASASQGFQAVYNGTKAFIDSFSCALRNELKETDVTVTWLMPGATATRFFERAGMLDTKVGQDEKDDPADVARAGYDAMLNGEGDVVSGWKNKIQASLANVTPANILAEQHRKMAEPGSAGG